MRVTQWLASVALATLLGAPGAGMAEDIDRAINLYFAR